MCIGCVIPSPHSNSKSLSSKRTWPCKGPIYKVFTYNHVSSRWKFPNSQLERKRNFGKQIWRTTYYVLSWKINLEIWERKNLSVLINFTFPFGKEKFFTKLWILKWRIYVSSIYNNYYWVFEKSLLIFPISVTNSTTELSLYLFEMLVWVNRMLSQTFGKMAKKWKFQHASVQKREEPFLLNEIPKNFFQNIKWKFVERTRFVD